MARTRQSNTAAYAYRDEPAISREAERAEPKRTPGASRRKEAPRQDAVALRSAHLIHMTASEKFRMVVAVIILGAMFLGVIFLAAYGASVQREINRINAKAAVLQEEIDNLTLAIEKGRNIETIEKKALVEYGMIYPTGSQLKYLEELQLHPEDMAQTIKEHAYGA
ncbi:MAG: hypothetical protein LBQ21_02055 [Clostridiales Family XIII bacterium]|jgi:cell division protein FtsL|nr:hypothetical protein [Clostridiales Family XIII bacterium]